MRSYNNFIGIDIGKKTFVVAIHGERSTQEYDNDEQGIAQFIKDNKEILSEGLCVLEATGGYEMYILIALLGEQFFAHRAHEGLWDLLRVLYGAIQIVVGTLMARRFSKLADLMPMNCLDRERTHLIFFVGKTGYDGKRECVVRPIPAVGAKLIGLLERLQITLLKDNIIKQYSSLFTYPPTFL